MSELRVLMALVIAVMLFFVIAPTRTPAKTSAGKHTGITSYRVGVRYLALDTDPWHALTVSVWYPALAPKPDSANVIPDARPDVRNGPYPLVVFSQFATGPRPTDSSPMELLASQGFVVLVPVTQGESSPPTDMKRIIDQAPTLVGPSGVLPGMIDLQSIALPGEMPVG